MIVRKALLYWKSRHRRFGLQAVDSAAPTQADYRRLAREADEVLVRDDIAVWFPRSLNEAQGGFNSHYSFTWQPLPPQPRNVVFQARMTWVAAQVSERMAGDDAARFHGYARHGLKFLREKLWDAKHGGFFWNLNPEGGLPSGDPGEKYIYGQAFAIYAAASLARAAGDADALAFAQEAFRWMDEHAHDKVNGGYDEVLDPTGRPLPYAPEVVKWNLLNTPYGYKSVNTQVHILEALIELYRVWPDPVVRERLEELCRLTLEKMFVIPGCLHQFYTADFRPVPALDSYGHDVETAYLLVEAMRVLGQPDDARVWKTAQLLTNNTLTYALDGNHGGIFDVGPTFRPATGLEKPWWAQAELLNALLYLHERIGTDDLRYWTAYRLTWNFIRERQIDAKRGGWHQVVWADNQPIPEPKGHNWKDPYHTVRALLNASVILHRLGGETLPVLKP